MLSPETVKTTSWIKAVFPITTTEYWYITSYVGMYAFVPFLNSMVEQNEKKKLRFLLCSIFILFCCIPRFLIQSPYGLLGGHSMLWVSILYVAGAYVRKYNILNVISVKKATYIFIISTVWHG